LGDGSIVVEEAGHRREGQSKRHGVGRVPQRDEYGLGVPEERRAIAVAVVPQFGQQLLAPGRWSGQVAIVMAYLLQGK
jgi:hypothetical protein